MYMPSSLRHFIHQSNFLESGIIEFLCVRCFRLPKIFGCTGQSEFDVMQADQIEAELRQAPCLALNVFVTGRSEE